MINYAGSVDFLLPPLFPASPQEASVFPALPRVSGCVFLARGPAPWLIKN